MGTRADFYMGRGLKAKWLGSIAWDGYLSNIPNDVLGAKTSRQFRRALTKMSAREDWTKPEDGWPWPWNNSQTTDYSYAFEKGKVWVSCFGSKFVQVATAKKYERGEWPEGDGKVAFPDMSKVKNVQIGGVKSGVILVGKTAGGRTVIK